MGGDGVVSAAGGGNVVVYVALFGVQMLKAGYYIFSKVALNSNAISPMMLCFMRELIAAPLMMLFAVATIKRFPTKPLLVPEKKDLPRFIGLGVGIFATQVFFLWGLDYTSPTNASIMQPLIPVVTAILSWLLGYERLNVIKVMGILAAIIGAVIMMVFSSTNSASSGHPMKNPLLGNAFLIVDCLGLSSFILLQRPIIGKYAPTVISAWGYAFGATFVAIVSAPEWIKGENWTAIGANASVIGAIVYSAIGASALAFGLYTWANGKVQEVVTLLFQAAQPFWTALLAVLVLKYKITMFEVLGAAFILTGLLVVCYVKDKELKLKRKLAEDTQKFQQVQDESSPLINNNSQLDKDTQTTPTQSP
jgi:drug/metabolite transporter (DMT)-like permease